MRVIVDAQPHVGILEGASGPGEQIGQIHGAGVRGAFGDAEKKVTIARHRGTVPAGERREVLHEPPQADEVALVQSHESDEAPRPRAP